MFLFFCKLEFFHPQTEVYFLTNHPFDELEGARGV